MRSDPVILVAEDSENDVLMLRRAFKHLNISAPLQVVPNGEEAISYLEGAGEFGNRQEYPLPDIILLDLKMPRKNGFEVLKWWRNQKHLAAMRIVVLTTSDEIRDVNEGYRAGAASFLVKPLNFEEFRNTIYAMVEYWRNSHPAESSCGDSRKLQNGSAPK